MGNSSKSGMVKSGGRVTQGGSVNPGGSSIFSDIWNEETEEERKI